MYKEWYTKLKRHKYKFYKTHTAVWKPQRFHYQYIKSKSRSRIDDTKMLIHSRSLRLRGFSNMVKFKLFSWRFVHHANVSISLICSLTSPTPPLLFVWTLPKQMFNSNWSQWVCLIYWLRSCVFICVSHFAVHSQAVKYFDFMHWWWVLRDLETAVCELCFIFVSS